MLETRETKLDVEVEPGPGVSGYSLYVDGLPAAIDAHHKGKVVCAGSCGDGSRHALLYSFVGSQGATLAITVRCSGRIVCSLRVEISGAEGSQSRGGRKIFAI
jgi:hypothetical protein